MKTFRFLHLSLLLLFVHAFIYGQSNEISEPDFELIEKMAKIGDSKCQLLLGMRYYKGIGVEKDYIVAEKWFKIVAEKGVDFAQYALGRVYEERLNYDEAITWYEKAAAQDYKAAKERLKEIGQIKNAVAALKWVRFKASSSTKNFPFKIDIESNSQIEDIKVYINGALTRGFSPIKNDVFNFTLDRNVELSEGDNVIKVEVKNASGWASSEKVITYQPEKPQPVVQKEKRLALVIGNSDYHSNSFPKLENTLNDARVIHAKLKSLGFDMQPILLDANKNQLWDAITNFINKINNDSYDVAIVYYSGHGLSPDGGANYMIPIDANIKYLDEVKRDGINSQTDLIGEMERSHCKVKIVLMDCCNNCNVPERGTKSAVCQGGLSKMNPEGVYILHAAHPGRTAIDGIDSENSPFAQALLESIDNNPNTVWELLVKDVIESVDRKTQGRQIPYPEGIIKGKFYLNKQ